MYKCVWMYPHMVWEYNIIYITQSSIQREVSRTCTTHHSRGSVENLFPTFPAKLPRTYSGFCVHTCGTNSKKYLLQVLKNMKNKYKNIFKITLYVRWCVAQWYIYFFKLHNAPCSKIHTCVLTHIKIWIYIYMHNVFE